MQLRGKGMQKENCTGRCGVKTNRWVKNSHEAAKHGDAKCGSSELFSLFSSPLLTVLRTVSSGKDSFAFA